MIIRPLKEKDRPEIEDILRRTKVFSEEEILVALELIDIYLTDKKQKDYDIYSAADENDTALGYVCIGPTPMTLGTFDLYWIAVNPEVHGKGIGKELVKFIEKLISERKGRLIVVETSSREDYEPTRNFYIRIQYKEISRIKDYYKINDDLVVYGKYLNN
jgi:ribosomal protein S18 acetylase RimI-like enzyme